MARSDIDTVIKTATGCVYDGSYCNKCIYEGCITQHGGCEKDLIADMVELLKNSVPQSVVDQIRWERDTALSQLKEIGKGLGEKMDDAKLKKGHWEVRKRQRTYTGTPYIKYRCSVCGEWVDQYENSAFCPFCGADMRGEQDEKGNN